MKTDCFACEGKCTTLRDQKCDACSFYKTEAQDAAGKLHNVQYLKTEGKWEYYKLKYGLDERGVPAVARIRRRCG